MRPRYAEGVFPRTTTIEADGHTIDVHYLMVRAEADLNERPHMCGPVAAGVERMWLERARLEEEANDHEGSKLSMQRAAIWGDIANRLWPRACMDLVAALPDLDAFFVIPSSRAMRRDPLVHALLTRFPNAVELTYMRTEGVRFGSATEDAIVHALTRSGSAVVPDGARVTVADDWAGGGATLRASLRRVLADYRGHVGSINAAVPGVSAVPIKVPAKRE